MVEKYGALEAAKILLRSRIKLLETNITKLDTMKPDELEKLSDSIRRKIAWFDEFYRDLVEPVVEPDDEYRSLFSHSEKLVGRIEAYLNHLKNKNYISIYEVTKGRTFEEYILGNPAREINGIFHRYIKKKQTGPATVPASLTIYAALDRDG